jgi:tetratricopeptide (TPR) repeat protein
MYDCGFERVNRRFVISQCAITIRWSLILPTDHRPWGNLWMLVMACTLVMSLSGCQQNSAPSSELSSSTSAVTFSRDVAPIAFQKCAGCHHPGEAAPFSLLTYDDVRRRASQIIDVTQKRFMPPWLPDEKKNEFIGQRRLTDHELETLQQWVAAGTPRGEESQMPSAPVFQDGWQTGTPDLVLESPAYTLKSQERDVFRNFVIPIQLDAPRWVESIELRPENPRVTHHARLGVDSSNESKRRDDQDPEPGYAGMAWAQDPEGQLVIWAPGMVATPGTPGIAWRLYPNSCLVLHTHMQPSGKPETVKFRIGIHFAKQAPVQHPVMLRIGSCAIDIPPGDKHYTITDEYVLPIDVDVQTVFPHAHSLCQEVRVTATLPDGSSKPLISIDHFDENWHDLYRYKEPIRLPQGTRLITTFVYDNTDENVRNRNHPARRVVYGSNVNDEMQDVYLQVTPVHEDQREVLMENYKRYELQSQVAGNTKSLEQYPDNTWSQEGLATAYVGLGEYQKAIEILNQRLKVVPLEVFPVVSMGMALLASGDNASAEKQLRLATTMDSQYPLAWFGLGKALAAEKQSEPASQAFRQAVTLAPGLSDAHLGLANLLVKQGHLDEAAQECTAALNDSPEMANVYLKLAEISAKRQNYEESLEYCKKARQAAPYTHPPKVLLAVFCIANGDPELALRMFREAQTEEPSYPVTPLMLGQLAMKQQDWDAARQYLTAAAALPIPANWPESHRKRFLILLHSERFRLAQQLQDINLARDALGQWVKSEPENTQLREKYEELRTTAAH